jgi:hypothetical protein
MNANRHENAILTYVKPTVISCANQEVKSFNVQTHKLRGIIITTWSSSKLTENYLATRNIIPTAVQQLCLLTTMRWQKKFPWNTGMTAQGFPFSAVIIPSSPLWTMSVTPTCLSLVKVIPTYIHVNRMTRLEGNTGKCAGGGSITPVGDLEGASIHGSYFTVSVH